jgi:hypothetical protein
MLDSAAVVNDGRLGAAVARSRVVVNRFDDDTVVLEAADNRPRPLPQSSPNRWPSEKPPPRAYAFFAACAPGVPTRSLR